MLVACVCLCVCVNIVNICVFVILFGCYNYLYLLRVHCTLIDIAMMVNNFIIKTVQIMIVKWFLL